ncbi:MAG: tricorn protease [Candidatus Krumholzibacteriia bacterium]
MNRLFIFVLLLATSMAVAAFGDDSSPGYVMRYADVNADNIVFTYEDDLWLVPVAGGDARRITSHEGIERSAKFSPDGSLLAFTGDYDGGGDVYIMPREGGVPVRLTFHPGGGTVCGWSPDGQRVLFSSNREAPFFASELYSISVAGGMAESLPVDRGSLASMAPDGSAMAFNRYGRHTRTWKRYQGGNAQDIWVVDFGSGDIVKVTDWTGSDQFPMWGSDGIYFNSDREDGNLNIYRYNPVDKSTTRITQHTEFDVKWPSYGDGKIVYQNGPGLNVLDTASGTTSTVAININSDRRHLRPELVTAAPRRGSFGLSPAGERALIVARGEVLNLPSDKGDGLNLTRTSGSREKNATWSPDGRWVAMVSDRSGDEQIYLVDQRGEEEWRQLTDGTFGYMNQSVWSPDSKSLIFSDKFMKLHLVDVASGKIKEIAQSDYDDAWERWGIMDYVWSPDSRWVAFTSQTKSMNEAIHLYDTKSGDSQKLTDDMTEDWSPSFSPDGKYLYFLSNRTFNPIMGRQDQTHVFLKMSKPYMFLLQNDVRSPFEMDDVAVAVDAGEDEDKDSDAEADELTLDVEGLAARVLACDGVDAGNYFRLTAVEGGFLMLKKDDPEFLKYQNVDDTTGGNLDLLKYSLEDEEAESIMSGIANYHLSSDGEQLIYRAGSSYGMVSSSKGGKVGDGKIDLSAVELHVDRLAEFPVIFAEAWRIQRDWFYDENMHGVDWQAMYDKYSPFVGGCGTRGDLNYLIGEMISELNIGHTYIFGGDFEDGADRVGSGALGAEFTAVEDAEFYQISKIFPGVSWDQRFRSPLAAPGLAIAEGDYLIAIDGAEVKVGENVYASLHNKGNKIITITTNDKAEAKGAVTHRVRTLRGEFSLRARHWMDSKQDYVDENSDNQIGYLQLPNMGQGGLVEFGRNYYPQTSKRAMIIDDRYNGGGFVGDMIIDRLERVLWGLTQPREGLSGSNPERAFHGPLVVLINGDTYSNGEFFAEAIKRMGLGVTIGERTWGGTTGIEAHQNMVDGGGTTPPQFGLYGLDGTWPVEGWGVEPDIIIINTPNEELAGVDSQLDYAIEHLLKELADSHGRWDIPVAPEYPDKAKPQMSRWE